jgi:hypothetical protein
MKPNGREAKVYSPKYLKVSKQWTKGRSLRPTSMHLQSRSHAGNEKIFWKGTDDWNELLAERAAIRKIGAQRFHKENIRKV